MTSVPKKQWSTPKVTRLTLDEAAASCDQASKVEQAKLNELLKELRGRSARLNPEKHLRKSTKT